MKRTAILILVGTLVVGCGKNEPIATQSTQETPNLETVTTKNGEQDFARQIRDMTDRARSFESSLNFAEAAKAWQAVDAALSQKHGAESWQPANARLSAVTAKVQISFTAEQREQSKLAQIAQQKMTDALAKKDFQGAIQLANQSTELSKSLFGENSPIVAKQLLQIGNIHRAAGNVDAAISSFHQAAERLRSTFHTRHPDLELAHHELGQLYLVKKSYSPAISNLKTSTKLASAIWGEDSLMYARGANQLGVAYYQSGELQTALKIHKAAELIRARKLGENNPLVAHSRLNAAVANIDMKQYEAAEVDLNKAIPVFDPKKPDEAHLLKLSRAKLATIYMLTQRPALAEPVLNTMLQNQVSRNGMDNVVTADLQYRLGIAQARQGKYDLAEPELRRALALQKKAFGPSAQPTIKTMQAIALLLKQTRRNGEAQEMQQEILRVAKENKSNEFTR